VDVAGRSSGGGDRRTKAPSFPSAKHPLHAALRTRLFGSLPARFKNANSSLETDASFTFGGMRKAWPATVRVATARARAE